MNGGKFDEAVVFMNCSNCNREMRKIASDIMTKKAFENAITIVIALGGSTNAPKTPKPRSCGKINNYKNEKSDK